MTGFTFLTSGPIDYSFAGMGLYESICQTSLGLRFPGLRRGAEKEIEKRIKKLGLRKKSLSLVSASSNQTRETANELGKVLKISFKIDQRLDLIRFDFKNIMSEGEFRSLGDQAFDLARPRFLKAFFENRLLESKLSVKKRVDSFLKDHLETDRTTLAVSHSFLMMIIKAYLVAGEKVFRDPRVLNELCQPDKRPFDFLAGFQAILTLGLKVNSLEVLK